MFRKNYIFSIYKYEDDENMMIAAQCVGRNVGDVLKNSSFIMKEWGVEFHLKLTAKRLMTLINDLSDNKIVFDVKKG